MQSCFVYKQTLLFLNKNYQLLNQSCKNLIAYVYFVSYVDLLI